jgi:hypothetical protein
VARTAKRIIDGAQLTTSAATYYTVGTGTSCILRRLTFTNTSAGAVTVTLYLVPSGGSAGDSTTLSKTKSLAAAESWSCPDAEGHVMAAGGTVQALASSATSITLIGSGTEVV